MKDRIIILGTLLFLTTGMISAQICPPTNGNSWNRNTSYFNNAWNSSFTNAYSPMQNLAYSFSSIIERGYRNGNLTESEIKWLERDYRNVEREMRWAYIDGRVSFHERSMIDMYIRKLERNIDREWRDGERRLG